MPMPTNIGDTNSGDNNTGTMNSAKVEQMGWATNEQRGQQHGDNNDAGTMTQHLSFSFISFFLSFLFFILLALLRAPARRVCVISFISI